MNKEYSFGLGEIEGAAEMVVMALGERRIARLIGEMGAGKTTLIKAICKRMGVEEEVNSPTFAIVNEYKGKEGVVYHFDFYRLREAREAVDLGLGEYLYSGGYVFMEWPQIVEEYLPEDTATIEIWEEADGRRMVRVD